jgi:hypothetical protein
MSHVFFSCFFRFLNDNGKWSSMTFDNAKIQNSGRMALKQGDCTASVSIDAMLPYRRKVYTGGSD